MVGTLLWEKGGLGSRYRGLGVSLEDKLSQALYRVSGEAEAVLPREPADLAPRGAGPSVRGQALVWMSRGRAFTSSPVFCHRGYGRTYFPPPEEAQTRTGAVGGKWCPVDWLGRPGVSPSPFPAKMPRLAGAFLPPRPLLTPARCTGVRGGLSSRVGCMGRAVRSN